MAVYCWYEWGGTETFDMLNPSTGQSELIDGPISLPNVQNGVWVVCYFTGNVNLHVVETSDESPAVVALAFDNQYSSPCAAPVFSPATGTYTNTAAVTITTSTSGATIRYTTDGSTPGETAGTVYGSPVSITSTSTLQAIACLAGSPDSPITSGVYAIQCVAPTFTPAAGLYATAQAVTISSITSGATIRYTTDGSTPNETHGTVYSNPVNISANTTLLAIAYKAGTTDSVMATGQYYFQNPGYWYTDNLTQGSWWSLAAGYVYGNDGYVLCAWNNDNSDVVSLNGSYVQSVTPINYSGYYMAYCDSPANQTDPRTLINPATGTRAAGEWYCNGGYPGSFCDIAVTLANPNDGLLHRMAVYCWYIWGGTETFDMLNPSTDQSELIGGPISLPNVQNGVWVVCYFTGNVHLHVVETSNESPAVVALAFDNQYSNPCAAPVFSPATGTYTNVAAVTITTTTGGATIRYTTDGSTPGETAGTVYSSAVNLTSTSTIQAIACLAGNPDSPITSGVYTIQCIAPTFTPAAGAYGPTQSVTINTTTGGAAIRYTTNGAIPSSTLGTVYSSPVNISATSTLQAIAYETGQVNSSVTSGVYTINGACAIPTFSPAASTFTTSTSVTISTTTGGATIRYTTNGSTPTEDAGTVYSSPVSITANCTLQAIAYESGYSDSSVASGAYIIQCATPTFSPTTGTYTTSTSVTLSTATSGASIRYTTNGTTPSSTVGTVYSNAVSITATATLQAIAYATGLTNSAVASGVYTIQCAVPTFNPVVGTFTTSTTVTISAATSGASIRYTTNGTTPSSTVGTVYSNAVNITATSTLQAIAYAAGLTNSAVVSGVYTIQCATPTFTPAAGTFTTSTTVTIATSTSGASIRYTTNGTTPSSTVGTVYSSAVSITATSTLQAIAYATGLTNSAVSSGVYTIQCAVPTFNPAAGTYTSATVTITTATSGASIRYTTNGTTPSSTVGTVYSSPVAISATETLQAIAYKTGLSNSAITSAAYTIYIGYTTVGSTNTAITANEMRGTRFQAGSAMTINHINLDIGTSVSGNIQCAIYTDSSSAPGTLLKGTGSLSNPGTGWQTFTLTSSQALTSGSYYWLLFWSAANYSVQNTTSSGASWYRILTYGSWPSSAGSGTTETRTWSVYGY